MTTNNNEFKVKFWGVRGSYPTPSADKLKYGGNTACIEVNAGGHQIILDAGTGIIELGNQIMTSYIASGSSMENRRHITSTVLVSHSHHDHVQGIPFFRPIYIKSSIISFWGPKTDKTEFKDVISKTMFSKFFPLDLEEISGKVSLNNLNDLEVLLLHPDSVEPEVIQTNMLEHIEISPDTVVIHCMKSHAHPKNGVLVFKINYMNKSLVYATDKESYSGGDRKLSTFARNTDLLIHDSQYTHEDYTSPIVPKQGFGHSTPEMAIEAARQCNAKKLVLFHLEPSYDDCTMDKMAESVKGLMPHCQVAHEGLELNLL